MDKGLAFIYLYLFAVTIIIVFGVIGTPEILEVDVGYINGILTASSILFGFWATILGIQPKDMIEKFLRINVLKLMIFFNIVILAISVIFVYLSAMIKLPSKFALIMVTTSFLTNVMFLGTYLYFYFERLHTTYKKGERRTTTLNR